MGIVFCFIYKILKAISPIYLVYISIAVNCTYILNKVYMIVVYFKICGFDMVDLTLTLTSLSMIINNIGCTCRKTVILHTFSINATILRKVDATF